MKIAALIPARLSSKRLPEKNILPLRGKPLLFWSIDAAIKAEIFDTICVSTESDRVIKLVNEHYPQSMVHTLKRPEYLSTDTADLKDVCTHFLDLTPDVEYLSLLMPTYPFRQPDRYRQDIFPALASRQVDRVVSVRPESFSTFDFWLQADGVFERMFLKNPLWCSAGNAVYFTHRRDYLYIPPHKWPCSIGERTLRLQTSAIEAIDIDTQQDFETATKISLKYQLKWARLCIRETESHEFVLPVEADLDSFIAFLRSKDIDFANPILILEKPPPYFTFLRLTECNSSHNYYSETSRQIIADLPSAGHSQDFPPHYIQSKSYRILRKQMDLNGITDEKVPQTQAIMIEDLTQWDGFIPPCKFVFNDQ